MGRRSDLVAPRRKLLTCFALRITGRLVKCKAALENETLRLRSLEFLDSLHLNLFNSSKYCNK